MQEDSIDIKAFDKKNVPVIRLLGRNEPYLIGVLLIYSIGLYLHAFWFGEATLPNPNINSLPLPTMALPPFWCSVLCLVLVLIEALWLNHLVNHYKMGRSNTYFTALSYVLITAALPEFLELHTLHFANLLQILVLAQLFKSYKKDNATALLFNAGFFVATSSLIYFSLQSFLIFLLIGWVQVRSFNVRELIALMLGFAVPYFLLGVWLFWIDQLDRLPAVLFNYAFADFSWTLDQFFYLKLSLIALLVGIAFLGYNQFYYRTTIQVQKNISLLYIHLIIGTLALLFQPAVTLTHFLILAPSLSIFLGFTFQVIKNKLLSELLHLSLLVIVLILQYHDDLLSMIFK